MALEHERFGVLDDDGSGGLRWAETIDAGDQAVDVVVTAEDAQAVDPHAVDEAAAAVGVLETLDTRGRDALIADLSAKRSVAAAYVDGREEELGEDLADLIVDTSGDLAVDVLASLQLLAAVIRLEESGAGDPFLTLVYSIDPDGTDATLSVTFDVGGDLVVVDSED